MRSFVLVSWIFLTLVVGTRACAVGEKLLQSENTTEYAFEYGTYTGFKEELAIELIDPSAETHLCFYVPDIINQCLHDDDFLSCEQQSYCQHGREDIIKSRDNETMRIITVNFRMMPPDDEKDEAYVIRLYNRTVVWLTTVVSCSDLSHELSQESKPRIYMYYNLPDNTTTMPPDNTSTCPPDNTSTCPVCSMTDSPTTTPISTDTPTAEAGSVSAGVATGICTSSFILGVVIGCAIIIVCIILKKCLTRRSSKVQHCPDKK